MPSPGVLLPVVTDTFSRSLKATRPFPDEGDVLCITATFCAVGVQLFRELYGWAGVITDHYRGRDQRNRPIATQFDCTYLFRQKEQHANAVCTAAAKPANDPQ